MWLIAPNLASERIGFFKQLFKVIQFLGLNNNNNIIITCDFNTPLEVRNRKGSGSFNYEVPDCLYDLCNKL